MARNYKTGLLITGDASGAIRATKLTREELNKLNSATSKGTASNRQFRNSIAVTSDGLSSLTKIATIAGTAIAAIGIGRLATDFFEVNRSSEKMKAGLATVIGSVEGASMAFENLDKFAQRTPFTLDQAVEGFVKLKALGLDPSERAMMSYANTSAAMGKSLTQMIEAVADASTFEFERLKEFGIKAKQQGDNVTFTFQGVATTIQKNAADITEYLNGIGENSFGDAAANQMKTMDGQLSNLEMAVNSVYRTIGDAGALDAMKSGVEGISSVVVDFDMWLKTLDFSMDEFGDTAEAVATVIGTVLVAKIGLSTVEFANSSAELVRYQQSLARMQGTTLLAGAAQDSLAKSTNLLKGAFAAVGGGAGIGLAVIGLAAWVGMTLDAVESNDSLSSSLDRLKAAYAKANAEQRAALELDFADQLNTTQSSIRNVAAALDDLTEKRRALSSQRESLIDNGAGESNLLVSALTDRLAENEEAIIRQKAVMSGLEEVYLDTQQAIDGLGDVVEVSKDKIVETGEAAGVAAGGMGELRDSTLTLVDTLEPLRAALEKHQAALAAINELEGQSGFTAERLAELRAAQTAQYDAQVAKINELATGTKAYSSSLDSVLDSIFPLRDAQREFNADLAVLEAALAKGGDDADMYRKAIAKLKTDFEEANDPLKELTKNLDALLGSIDPVAKAESELAKKSALLRAGLEANKFSLIEYNKQMKLLRDSYADALDPMSEMKKQQGDLLDELLPLAAAQRDYREELELTLEALDANGSSEEDRATALDNLRIKYEDLSGTIDDHRDQAAGVATSWEAAMQRVDEVFADAWTGAFDSFDSFKDQLVGSFKDLFGELAHQAITNPILIRTGVSGGGSFAEQAAGLLGGSGQQQQGGFNLGSLFTQGGTFSSVLNSGLATILGTANSYIATGASNLFQGLNAIGANGATNYLATGLTNQTILGNQVGNAVGIQGGGASVGFLTTAAAGYAGGYLGNELGESLSDKQANSSYGQAAGGIAGAAIGAKIGVVAGPIGAAIGAAIGALVDVFTGSEGHNRVAVGVGTGNSPYFRDVISDETGASGIRLRSINNRGEQAGYDAAESLLGTLLQIDGALTELARRSDVEVDFSNTILGDNTGQSGHPELEKLFFGVFGSGAADEGDLAGAADSFARQWIDQISDQLPKRVKDLLPSINQTASELITAFEAVVNIDELLDIDVVNLTQEAVAELSGEQLTLLDAYDQMTSAVIDQSAIVDGSAESWAVLNNILIDQKNAATALTVAYAAVGEQIDLTFGNAIDTIKESLLSEEELYNHRREQISELTSQLQTTVDPEAIGNIVAQLDQLSTSAFNSLDDTQQESLSGEFIAFLEDARDIASERVDSGLSELRDRETAVVNTIDFELINVEARQAAAAQQSAAEAQQLAAAAQAEAVERFNQGTLVFQAALANGSLGGVVDYGAIAQGLSEIGL